jgi:hypothetical protein
MHFLPPEIIFLPPEMHFWWQEIHFWWQDLFLWQEMRFLPNFKVLGLCGKSGEICIGGAM